MSSKFKALAILIIFFGGTYGAYRAFQTINQQYTKIDPNYTIQYKYIDGVQSDLLSFDVYLPKIINQNSPGSPMMIYVHGGGFWQGDKDKGIDQKASYFTERGMLFFSVNYRLSPENYSELNPDRIKYPVYQEDVAAAIAYIHTNCSQWGGDPNRLVLMGHSAGGYIITTLSMNEQFLNFHNKNLAILKGTVVLDAPGYNVTNSVANGDEMFISAVGTDTIVTDEASPVNHIEPNKGIPPFLIFCQGNSSTVALVQLFGSNLNTINGNTEVYDVSPLTHGEVNEVVGSQSDTVVTPKIRDFLIDLLGDT